MPKSFTNKLNKLRPRKPFPRHLRDTPEVVKLKQELVDAAEKVKKEGIR